MHHQNQRWQSLATLDQELKKGIIGQDHAIESVSSIVRRGELNLTEPGKPKGSFLFLGPTGVGKTQLAKDFTRLISSDEAERLAVFDMSEYQQSNAIESLLGTRTSEGSFHKLLRPQVKTIVLDEIEKAHRPALDLLLQMLDEARVTLADGRVVDFQQRYVVMTSNIASEAILLAQSGSPTSMERFATTQAQKFLRPELLGRIDLVEIFRPLNFNQRVEIGRLIAEKETSRLRSLGEDVEEVISDTLLAMCAKDCDLGVRPLRRRIHGLIQESIVSRKLSAT